MKNVKRNGRLNKANMNNTPDLQTYSYSGPERYHSLVGQVMASLGYVGGRECRTIGAAVVLEERDGRLRLSCAFGGDGAWRSETWLCQPGEERTHIKDCLLHWHEQFSGKPKSPWGTLIGVRPTKLVHRLFDEGMDAEEARRHLCGRYEVAEDTAKFLVQMAAVQRPYVTGGKKDISVYVGIPYCPSHCVYCSFPSRLIGEENDGILQDFADAVVADIEDMNRLCRQYGLRIRSAYVGGGTPTCLPLPILRRLMTAMSSVFAGAEEWTVEAGRPDTASEDVLALLRRCGVTRISVNPQTMQQRLLDAIGRRHTTEDIYRMYERCRQMAFPVVNMDFIAGLPGQTAADMRENMEIVCQLHPENVTIHTLALKKRAPLFHHPLREKIPSAEEVGAMLDVCRQTLQKGGYGPYYMYRQTYMAASFANVGYALPGAISPYNIEMMEERGTVLAAGPGGATKFVRSDGHSLEKLYMPKDIDRYIEALPENMRQRRRLCAIIYGGEDL